MDHGKLWGLSTYFRSANSIDIGFLFLGHATPLDIQDAFVLSREVGKKFGASVKPDRLRNADRSGIFYSQDDAFMDIDHKQFHQNGVTLVIRADSKKEIDFEQFDEFIRAAAKKLWSNFAEGENPNIVEGDILNGTVIKLKQQVSTVLGVDDIVPAKTTGTITSYIPESDEYTATFLVPNHPTGVDAIVKADQFTTVEMEQQLPEPTERDIKLPGQMPSKVASPYKTDPFHRRAVSPFWNEFFSEFPGEYVKKVQGNKVVIGFDLDKLLKPKTALWESKQWRKVLNFLAREFGRIFDHTEIPGDMEAATGKNREIVATLDVSHLKGNIEAGLEDISEQISSTIHYLLDKTGRMKEAANFVVAPYDVYGTSIKRGDMVSYQVVTNPKGAKAVYLRLVKDGKVTMLNFDTIQEARDAGWEI